jgi:glycerol-3-phosphate acyltransferase PlsX
MLKGSLGSMSTSVRIALDAMGGDHGPSVVIPGAAHALKTRPDIQFLLFGDEAKLAPYLAQHPELNGHVRVIHTQILFYVDGD